MKSKIHVPTLAALGLIFLFQVLLFVSYVNREVAWDLNLRGDPTWYTYFAYSTFDQVVQRDGHALLAQARASPWGFLGFLESVVPQFLFGSSRASILSLNLFYYLLAQAGTYFFFARVTRSRAGGFIALALFFAMESPFRGGAALNLRDFHLDLILYFLLFLLYYLVGASDSFRKLGPSLLVGALGAYVVAMRLVSLFIFITTFGAFAAALLVLWYFGKGVAKRDDELRIRNFILALVPYHVLAFVPIWIGWRALYDHYFRFIFDPVFRKQREGLYVMGARGKLEEALAVLKLVFLNDLGAWFAIGSAAILLAILLLRRGARTAGPSTSVAAEALPGAAPEIAAERTGFWSCGNFLASRRDRLLYHLFLFSGAFTSYAQHVAFPIKSDHMTRATTAPMVIAVLLLLVPWLLEARAARAAPSLLRGYGLAAVLALCAAAPSIAFYTSPGRGATERLEQAEVTRLFEDMGQINRALGNPSPAVSVDFVDSYALGALLDYQIYEWERHGTFFHYRPQLWSIDAPIALEKAKEFLSLSDLVLLSGAEYPENQWPLTKSIRPIRAELRKHVEASFARYGVYRLNGLEKELFYRPFVPATWKIAASASIDKKYGPEGLLVGSGQIWHAPWGKGPQWIEFTAPRPFVLKRIEMVSQDGTPERTPRSFVLSAREEGAPEAELLNVEEAGFSKEKVVVSWPVSVVAPHRVFRLTVTRNQGDPNLMTIQALRLEVEPQDVPGLKRGT